MKEAYYAQKRPTDTGIPQMIRIIMNYYINQMKKMENNPGMHVKRAL